MCEVKKFPSAVAILTIATNSASVFDGIISNSYRKSRLISALLHIAGWVSLLFPAAPNSLPTFLEFQSDLYVINPSLDADWGYFISPKMHRSNRLGAFWFVRHFNLPPRP